MVERRRWWWVAMLVAVFMCVGVSGCSSTGGAVDDAPPPEEDLYVEEDLMVEGQEPYAEAPAVDEAEDAAAVIDEAGEVEEPIAEPAPEAATDPNTIAVWVDWQGEGEGRVATVMVKGDEPFNMEATAEVSEELIGVLKARKAAIAGEGGAPVVKISAPTDVVFDSVVEPIMMASFKAGFGVKEVDYEARIVE